MGGKLGLGMRAVLAAAVACVLLFGIVEKVNADPTAYTVSIGPAATQAEGDSPGQNKLTFPLTVAPGAAGTDITVTYKVDGGSARRRRLRRAARRRSCRCRSPATRTQRTTRRRPSTSRRWCSPTMTADTVALGSTTEGKGK